MSVATSPILSSVFILLIFKVKMNISVHNWKRYENVVTSPSYANYSGPADYYADLIAHYSFEDPSKPYIMSTLGTNGPTLFFNEGLDSSHWSTSAVNGRIVNTLTFHGDG